MSTIDVAEAEGRLDALLAEVRDSDGRVTLLQDGRPVAELIPVQDRSRAHEEHELTSLHRAMVGRELRIWELKREVNALCAELGREPVYDTRPPAGGPESLGPESLQEEDPSGEKDAAEQGLLPAEILDMRALQHVLDSFCASVGIAAAIIDLDGQVLASANWQRICTHFHRVHPETRRRCIESDTYLANQLGEGRSYAIYRCRNGLTDAASPIVVKGRHIANAFVGQFHLEEPDEEEFRRQAAAFGFDEEDYLRALHEAPVMPEEKLPAILDFLTSVAEVAAVLGLNSWRAQRTLKTLERQRDFLRSQRTAAINLLDDARRAMMERDQMEANLLQAQKMESIGRLAGGVAHDFNNILTGISGFVEFARDAAAPDSSIRKDLDEVLTLTQRAARLTQQLLAFSRRQTLQLTVMDVNDLLGEISRLLEQLLGEDIDLLFMPGDHLGKVKVDPGQMEQVIVNLAVNARDAMPDGGKLTIETANVTLDEEYARTHPEVTPGPHVMIAISDTGCGMDEEVRRQIFEPFFTTKEKGSGLGLATTHGIVKQHGGNIWVYSEPGKGTTFKVYLPRTDTDGQAGSLEDEQGVPPSSGLETILVVEDDEAVLKAVERILRRDGYDVLTASTPTEAETVMVREGSRVALLLTDVVLPERNGRRLYESLHPRFPDLRVLYMSGYTDNAIAHRGVLDPGTPLLPKPFTSRALADKVREVLDAPQKKD